MNNTGVQACTCWCDPGHWLWSPLGNFDVNGTVADDNVSVKRHVSFTHKPAL